MPDNGIMVGGACKLYRNSATYDNPVWEEVVLARDVTPGGGFDFVEASDRETALKLYAKAQLDKPTTIVMRADISSAEYAGWVASANSRKDTLDLLILNAPRTTVGAVGWRGPHAVSLTGEPQEIGGAVFSTFEVRPARDVNGEYTMAAEILTGPVLDMTAITWD